MNIKFMCLALMVVASSLVQADERSMTSMVERPDVPVAEYYYGMKLDIAKVVGISEPSNECGIVSATMTYLDHAGARHTVGYQTFGSDCHED